MKRIIEMVGKQPVINPFKNTIIQQNRAKQILLGLQIIGHRA
jgi:hypothetical protein